MCGGESGERSAITHRTVVDFVLQDTFAWREALERIVGKAEGTVGGLLGLFPQIYMAQVDCFIGIFAEAPRGAGWLFVVLERLRRLRAWTGGPLAPGYKPKVSCPSRRARLLLAAAARKEDIARSRQGVKVLRKATPGSVREKVDLDANEVVGDTVVPEAVAGDTVVHQVHQQTRHCASGQEEEALRPLPSAERL